MHIIGFIDFKIDFIGHNSTLALFFAQNLLFFADWLRLLKNNEINSLSNESESKFLNAENEEEEANIARVSAILISPSKAYEIICSVYATIDSGNSSFNFDSELTKINEKLITALSINPFGFKDAKSPTHGQEWKSVTSYLAAFKQIYNFSNDVYIPLN